MTEESKKCKLTCQIELLAFLKYHVMCRTPDLLHWLSPHPHHPFCSKSILHFDSCAVAMLLPWDPTFWMDRADYAHLWSAGPSHLPRSVPGLQITAVTCMCNPQSCLFRGCWGAQVPCHTARRHTCVPLSWCHALGTCPNLEGFVSGRGGTWEVECWHVCQTHCYINSVDAGKQFAWFYHNNFHDAELAKI